MVYGKMILYLYLLLSLLLIIVWLVLTKIKKYPTKIQKNIG